MGFSFTNEFTDNQASDKCTRCRCKFHSDQLGKDVWVDTNWKRESENGPARYEVRATASAPECQADHGGATDDRVITQNAFDNANDDVTWDFFPQI